LSILNIGTNILNEYIWVIYGEVKTISQEGVIKEMCVYAANTSLYERLFESKGAINKKPIFLTGKWARVDLDLG
jgi:hypothetical protein